MATVLPWRILSLLSVLWCFFTPWISAQVMDEPDGILTVGGPRLVVIPSRIGCRSVVRCEGNGSTIVWRRFSVRGELMSRGNRVITLDMTDPDMDGVYALIGHLIHDPVQLTDSGLFTCMINSRILTTQLTVERDPAAVSVSQYNISDRTIGSPLAVLCPVDSCIANLTVQFRNEEDEVLDSVKVGDATTDVVQFNLIVTDTLPGLYNCRVTGEFMGEFEFVEYFNITGIPLPAPTTVTPPSRPPTTPRGGGAAYTTMSITIVLSLILVTLSLT